MAEAQKILERAHSLLQDGGVARGAMSRTKHGGATGPHLPEASSFCSVGAISRAVYELNAAEAAPSALALLRRVAEIPEGVSTTHWNDNQASDEEILEVFAIAAGVAQQQVLVA